MKTLKKIKKKLVIVATEQVCSAIELLGRCAVLALGAAYVLFPGKKQEY